MLTGGCLCGEVRYDAGADSFHQSACHCSVCRRASGAPFVAWFSVPRAHFRWLQGQAMSYASSVHGTRGFCPRCGTQLTFEDSAYPDEVDVTTCSLDHPEQLPPHSHIYTGTQLEWVKLNDGLPRYRGSRSEEEPPGGKASRSD
ncbi:GFA family protein [Janthinobacterium sp. GB1R12]|uniref:GFA family protein n=1 Tax=Janthinobacterium sp. GB1R12 TaxID=3424190 RepID=UPI003F23F0C9